MVGVHVSTIVGSTVMLDASSSLLYTIGPIFS